MTLIRCKRLNIVSSSRPNLFSHATSELSQDAFFCWLLEWADQSHSETQPALHEVAKGLVHGFCEAVGFDPPEPPFSLDVLRQVNGEVDIVALIEDKYALVIEDKVGTYSHSNQLERYQTAMRDEYGDRDPGFVYLQTGNQASYDKVRDKGWSPFTRQDLLRVLRKGEDSVQNAIFEDYLDYLEDIDASVRRYETTPIDQWEPRDSAYKGLFTALQDALGEGSWKYVANPSGGFMGFFWGWTDVPGGEIYLQLEEDELTVRVKVPDPDEQSELRNIWSKRIIEGVDEVDLEKPHFGKGETMKIAESGDYRIAQEDGLLDLERTASRLEDIQSAIETVVQQETGGSRDMDPSD